MKTKKFGLIILSILAFSLLASCYPVYRIAGSNVLLSFILGSLLPSGMAILGFATVVWARNKSDRIFMSAVTGIFLLKLLILGGCLVLLKLFTEIHVPIFIATVFVYYIAFMILQLWYLQRFTSSQPEKSEQVYS